jgi:hypothetical protein
MKPTEPLSRFVSKARIMCKRAAIVSSDYSRVCCVCEWCFFGCVRFRSLVSCVDKNERRICTVSYDVCKTGCVISNSKLLLPHVKIQDACQRSENVPSKSAAACCREARSCALQVNSQADKSIPKLWEVMIKSSFEVSQS